MKSRNDLVMTPLDQIARLKSEVRFLRIVIFLLVMSGTLVYGSVVFQKKHLHDKYKKIFGLEQRPPHYTEIMKILEPYVYSGIQKILRKDVFIDIDFQRGRWTLHNIHTYDEKGELVLLGGYRGLCGELAYDLSRKLRPLLGKEYRFEFMRVAEAGYFLDPRSSHYVLKLTLFKKPHQELLVDPTFKRFDFLQNCDNYVRGPVSSRLIFIDDKMRDAMLPIGYSVPLDIENGFLLDLFVDGVEGTFNEDNFVIALAATQQYRFANRRIYALRIKNGTFQVFENIYLAEWLLDPADYVKIKKQMKNWLKRVRPEVPVAAT